MSLPAGIHVDSSTVVAEPTNTKIAMAMERLVRLMLRLVDPGELSLTAAATLVTLERHGPRRVTELAVGEAVSQPAMTQLISRLHGLGLVDRQADPDDGRVVLVRITRAGRAALAERRRVRARRLAALLDRIDPADRAALVAALPAVDALEARWREGVARRDH